MSLVEGKRIEMVSKNYLKMMNRHNSETMSHGGDESNESTLIENLNYFLKNTAAFNNSNYKNEEDMTDLNSYFMNVAILSAKKRKNYKHQAGACIVTPSLHIVGIGHNTSKAPSSEFLAWIKKTNSAAFSSSSKLKKPEFIHHAELNAILNKKCFSLSMCTIYVTEFPCIECAKLIIQSDIKRVIYANESQCQKRSAEEKNATKALFNLSGVELVELK